MNGKINIIFGFIYFASTAVLGPVLLVPQLRENIGVLNETAQLVEKVKGVEDPKAIAPAVVSIFDYLKRLKGLSFLGGGVHAHGNLEALLNIVAGLVLISLAIPPTFKTLLSLIFIIGAIFHSGMLYLRGVFGIAWAGNFTLIGEIATVAGLLLMGVACIKGIKQAS